MRLPGAFALALVAARFGNVCCLLSPMPAMRFPGLGVVSKPDLASCPKCHGTSMRAAGEGSTYLDLLARKIELSRRPEAIKIPRPRLIRDFAVLLMRSSYQQVADELDFIPMDEFQRDFFLFRQDEWADYKGQYQGIQQGDLTDPAYFDFISFAQYASISRGMKAGRGIFEESVGAEGEKKTVQRDPTFADNRLLPGEHSRRVGDRILAYLQETYAKAGPVLIRDPSPIQVVEGVSGILTLLRLNLYMLDAGVSLDEKGQLLTVVVTAPASLWGQHVLAQRLDHPSTDFEAKVIMAFLRGCGVQSAYTTHFSGADIIHTFKL
ncbi:unnamed protein product [Discosporangium mesarthrocarpum]